MRTSAEPTAVVVLTGASSGIGRATALELARGGARVVLAARSEHALRELAEQCRELGGDALAVPTDVSEPDAVDALAGAAVDRFGRIDVWVNNAAVNAFSRFGEEPVEDVHRVIAVDLLGQVHGARAALRQFRAQGRGVLINVGSVLSVVPSPYQSAYVMAKHGVRALSACLRTELLDAPGIRVCTVMPGSVDTPLFDHVANRTGWGVKPLRPILAPERVAAAIVSCAARPRREVYVGWSARMAALQYALVPRLVERAAGRVVRRDHFTDQPADATSGNLFEPHGGLRRTSAGWRGGTSPSARRVAMAGAAALLLAAGARRSR
jgi:short-subunit dehydrogenase